MATREIQILDNGQMVISYIQRSGKWVCVYLNDSCKKDMLDDGIFSSSYFEFKTITEIELFFVMYTHLEIYRVGGRNESKTNTENAQNYSSRRKKAGNKKFAVWMTPATQENLKNLKKQTGLKNEELFSILVKNEFKLLKKKARLT